MKDLEIPPENDSTGPSGNRGQGSIHEITCSKNFPPQFLSVAWLIAMWLDGKTFKLLKVEDTGLSTRDL